MEKIGRRVVICCNRIFREQAAALQQQLKDEGIPNTLLTIEDANGEEITNRSSEEHKLRAFNAYFRKIQNNRTWALLVINPQKYEIENYIGPMTFASCVAAFAQRKRMYLLHGFPEKDGRPTVFAEELKSWRAVNLRGSLSRLKEEFQRLPHRKKSRTTHNHG